MTEERRNPWKATAIGMAVVFATALITGIVVANWSGQEKAKEVTVTPPRPAPHQAARPSASDIEFCNQYAGCQRHEGFEIQPGRHIEGPPFSRLRLCGGFPSDVAIAPVHRSMRPLLFMQVRYAPA